MDLEQFILFNPVTGSPKEIPEGAGNYFIVLKDGHSLPDVGLPVVMAKYRGMDIVYTGVAGSSSGLRRRITWAHFGDNAGRSTLRLTLGVLMGFKPIPRDVSNPHNGHTRFLPEEEKRLTDWMKDNLQVYYFPNDDYEAVEEELIASLNPPLNLMKNYNPVNSELRSHISYLRSQVEYIEPRRTSRKIDVLQDMLSAPESLLDDPEGKFLNLAKYLMNTFQIKKGDKLYWMTDIEFYIYTDSHRDIITYPRNCEAGRWFFHASGVDISFKSKVELKEHPKKHQLMPYLTKDAVFGGILIRGIVRDFDGAPIDGPMKVCDELFDQFNAFYPPADFPLIVPAKESRNAQVIPDKDGRVGLKDNAIEKVKSIRYNYSGIDGMHFKEGDLEEGYRKFLKAMYRFKAVL